LLITPELDYLGKLERELMQGSGRWVADFSESFRNVRVQGRAFDMFIRGNTRGRSGYFFSAMLSKTMLPSYAASCFVRVVGRGQTLSVEELGGYISTVHDYIRENEGRWAFLLLVYTGKIPEQIRQMILNLNDEVVGVACVDIQSMQVVNDSSFIGRSASRVIPKKWVYRPVDGGQLPKLDGVLQGRQWTKLAWIFGLSLLGFTLLSFVVAGLSSGTFAISQFGLLLNLVIAIIVTAAYSRGKYYNRVELNDSGLTLQIGRRAPLTVRWSDFDLVSLAGVQSGSFVVRLYNAADHTNYLDVPTSAVKVDSSLFRWTAMEKSGHGTSRFARL
jgi:hypothetical protein